MKPRRFILSTENARVEEVRRRVGQVIMNLELEDGKPVDITICDHDEPRTLAQNRMYWVAYVAPIADYTGYTKNEMHEVLLGECFGTEKVGSLVLPKKRSSSLSKAEMREYLDWIPRFAAENGIIIGVTEGG